jgi:ribonuclease VapC
MVVDSSALISILLEEPGYETLLEKIGSAEAVFLGAPTILETAMVLSARIRKDPRPILAGFLRRMNAQIVDFNQEHYEVAMSAFLRFGKGRHPAALNFGDCMSYALAVSSGQLLLFSGNDFSRTDIKAA